MKHFFVVNPASGNGREYEALVKNIHASCRERELEYEIKFTEYSGHATKLVSEELEKGCGETRFYACGGDGTVGEVATALVGFSDAQFTVIPIGTGNDFVRSFSPEGSFLSVENQLSGNYQNVDAVSAGKLVFVNMLNAGFDSAVVSTIAKLRQKSRIMRGKFAYIIGVIINFFKMPKVELDCELDGGERICGKFLLSAFSNGKYYGGGFKAASLAEVDDGILDIILVRPCSRFVFLSLIKKYKEGTLHEDKRSLKYVVFKKCRSAKVKFSDSVEVCVDGEMVTEHEFDIRVLPSALKFSLPRKV